MKLSNFKFALLLVTLTTNFLCLNAIQCLIDTYSGLIDGPNQGFNSFNHRDIFANSAFLSGCEICKLTITYLPNEKAFRAFPITKLECVAAATDDKSNGIGCGLCEGNSLKYSLVDVNWYKTCKLTSYDGLSTAYCSGVDKTTSTISSFSNTPSIITSCYQGSFTAETPLQPTKCPTNSILYFFSLFGGSGTFNSNNVFCATTWVRNSDGEVSALGKCHFLTTSLPIIPYPPDDIQNGLEMSYTPNVLRQTCNQDNCNNVLICHVGNYFQIPSDDSRNTMKRSLCYGTENSVCQMSVSWSTLNGYTLVGSCQRQGSCTTIETVLTGDKNTIGTQCCTTQYCNNPHAYSFYLANGATKFLTSFTSLCLLIFLSF